MKYLLISFFKSSNLGDLLLSEQIFKQFSHDFQLIKWDFATNQKVEGYSNNNEPCKSRETKTGEKEKRRNFILKRVKSFLLPTYSFFYMLFSPKWKCYKAALSEVDGILIGGGNMLMDRTWIPQYSTLFYKYVNLAKKKKKKIFVLDVGVGPLKTKFETFLVRRAISKADYFSVRDERSASISRKAIVARDPAFYLEAAPIDNKENLVGVSVIGNGKFLNCDYESYVSGLVSVILELQKQVEIVLYSTEKMDYSTIDEICKRIKSDKLLVQEIHSIDELIALYQRTKLIIGSRMHSLIIAMTQYVPTIAISWDNKVKALYEMANLEDRLFPINTVQSNKEQIVEKALHLMGCNVDQMEKTFVLENKNKLIREYNEISESIKGGKRNEKDV